MAEDRKEVATNRPVPGPYSPFSEFRTQMDRLFDDFFGPMRGTAFAPLAGFGRQVEGRIVPRIDMSESDDALEIAAELPGMEEKDIEVTLHDGVLAIRGEKREEREEKDKDYLMSERTYGAFHRAFRLPDSIDENQVNAHFEKGVLKVTLAKRPEVAKSGAKKIPIGNG